MHASLGISHWEVQVPLRISYKHCKTLKFLSRNKCKLGFFCLFLSFLSCNIVQKTTFLPITLHIIWHHFVTFRSKSINSFIKDIAAICIYTILLTITQCGKCRNLLSHFFCKNFVKTTVSQNYERFDFTKYFFPWERISLSSTLWITERSR